MECGCLAAYNASPGNKYPYPTPPAAIMGAYRFAGQDGLPRRQFYTDFTDGAPRLGFAYHAFNHVIRGRFSTFYQSMTQTSAGQTGFSQTTSYVNSLDGEFPSACPLGSSTCPEWSHSTGPYSLVNPFPNGLTSAPVRRLASYPIMGKVRALYLLTRFRVRINTH